MSLPRAIVRQEDDSLNSGDSSTSRKLIISRFRLGTSRPTVDLPGMRSTRIDSHSSARQRSSERVVILVYLIPGFGLNSKVVTTGPGLICVTEPPTPNSSNLAQIWRARSCSSSGS